MKAALVTGVSRRAGIGFAIAQRLEEAGARVFTHGWTPHDAAQPWGADESFAPSIDADFAEADAPTRVVAAARAALGPLDVLVVNHARSGLGRLDELTAEHLDAFLHENVRASLLLVKEFAAQYDDARGGGRSSCSRRARTSGRWRARSGTRFRKARSRSRRRQS